MTHSNAHPARCIPRKPFLPRMNSLRLTTFASALASLLSASAPAQSAPSVGSISPDQPFAVRAAPPATSFLPASLDEFEGKILVLMLMTPWCPICQSNAIAVGDGILAHFNAPSRGHLLGRNEQGVEIWSLLLSTEPAATWDSTNASFSAAQGFHQWGIDADVNRADPRLLLGHYRGGFIASNNLNDWGQDRRRLVILNLVENSPTHQYREVMFNQNAFDSSFFASARAAINAVQPGPALLTFAQWAVDSILPLGAAGPDDDPDSDGVSNLAEFFHGTDPLVADSSSELGRLVQVPAGLRFVYPRAKARSGVTVEHLVSPDLVHWSVVADPVLHVTDAGDHERVELVLPEAAGPLGTEATPSFYRLRLTNR